MGSPWKQTLKRQANYDSEKQEQKRNWRVIDILSPIRNVFSIPISSTPYRLEEYSRSSLNQPPSSSSRALSRSIPPRKQNHESNNTTTVKFDLTQSKNVNPTQLIKFRENNFQPKTLNNRKHKIKLNLQDLSIPNSTVLT